MKRAFATAALILVAGLNVFGQTVPKVVTEPWSDFNFSSVFGVQHVYTPFQSKGGAIAALQTGLPGTWWRNPEWVKTLGLTTDQQKKMDEALQQHRLKLVDLNASLEKEELILEPLVESVRPEDQAKVLAQIDRVADARAELEKANARMLLGIRQVLTQDQWDKLPSNKFHKLDFKLYKKN